MSLTEKVEVSRNISINAFDIQISEIRQGILFFYCTWAYVETQLQHVLNMHRQYPQIKLYLFDIEENGFEVFKENNIVKSHGNGETFWVVNGVIIEKILKYNSSKELQEAEKFTMILACSI